MPTSETVIASEDAQATTGTSFSTNIGTSPSMTVRLSTSVLDNNSAVYLKYPASKGVRIANLNVYGKLNTNWQLDNFNVYV
jgi:hypothetical protein